ncbi:phage tail assembly chaperone, partial [Citrobacter koseri]|uniref:phage tail assembly chaperone n=1 Tax=Citrobacter koseri TaxID=545 RepID=UPI0034D26FD6
MAEFEVDGQTYRSGRMNARTQFHVLRRMAPLLGPLQSLAANQGGANALPVFADAIGGLSDEATDYIL